MRHASFLAGLLAAGTLLPAQTTLPFHGLELDLPKGWSSQQADSVLLLTPAGWKANTRTGEAFGLLFDAATRQLDGEEFEATIDGAAEAILAGAQREGGMASVKVGTCDGRRFQYRLQNAEGQTILMRIHVVMAKNGAVAFFALGFPDKLTSRSAELTTMLGSLRPEGQQPKKRAFGMGGNRAGKVDEKGTPPADEPVVTTPAGPDGEPAEPAEQSASARLPGGKATNWKAIVFDLPKGWTTKPGQDTSGSLVLMPPDFGKSGLLDEVYALVGDGSMRSLDETSLNDKVQQGIDEIQPGLLMDGEPKAVRFGKTKGKVLTFRGPSASGQDLLATVYVFPTTTGVCALLGIGFPEKLQAREPQVLAMLATLRPAKAGAAGANAAELAGQWVLFTNFDATNGGGRTSDTTLNLNGDGSYTFRSETVNTNPLGGHASSEHDSGRWSVEGETMVFRSVSGATKSYQLQKRNHPKNNDPMILLNGQAFVTATPRAPW
ncbi:MAG: hypothetical protein JNN13_07675 [Planctomycetes bacterium]|nr:hypothetical protein [Planctomycetota bacterium]